MIEETSYIGMLIGSYRLLQEIGRGGSAVVYKAEHIYLQNNIVAIKILHKDYLASKEERDYFIREAQLLYKLKHDNILSLREVGDHEGKLYLVIDFASGGPLKKLLENRHPLPFQTSLAILSQVADALQYAHAQNIVHRDIKPDNILFGTQGNVLLADFGIAITLSETSIRHTIHAIGTLAYMAPEVFAGEVSHKCDQYALSCVAYELLTGKMPFIAKDFVEYMHKHQNVEPVAPTQLNPDLPASIDWAILKALSKNPKDRFQNISEFLAAITGSHADFPNFPNTPRRTKVLSPRTRIEQLLKDGEECCRQNRYDEALKIYEQIILIDPNHHEAYYLKGRSLEYLERLPDAYMAYRSAFGLNPQSSLGYLGLGHYEFACGRYEKAVEYFIEATRIAPTSASGYYYAANALVEIERYLEAHEYYKAATRHDPHFIEAYYNWAKLYISLARFEYAIKVYDFAISRNPKIIKTYNLKAALLNRLNRLEDAIKVCDEAIARNPQAINVYHAKVDLLKRLNRHEEAIKVYDQLIQLNHYAINVYYKKAALLSDLQYNQEAIEVYNEIIQLDPSAIDAYRKKADLLIKDHRRYQEALEVYDKIIQLDPSAIDAYHKKIKLLTYKQRYREALKAYEKVIRIPPNNRENKKRISELRERIGKIKLAKFAQDIKRVVYPLTLNPLVISIVTGIALHSWGIFIGTIIAEIVAILGCVGYTLVTDSSVGISIGLIPPTVIGIGWAWLIWLLSPSITSIILALLVSFIINLLIFYFIAIYVDEFKRSSLVSRFSSKFYFESETINKRW